MRKYETHNPKETNDLVIAAQEINEVLGLIPRIRCFDDQDQLEKKIKEVAEFVLKWQDLFSHETFNVVKNLTNSKVRKRRSFTSASHFVIRQKLLQR